VNLNGRGHDLKGHAPFSNAPLLKLDDLTPAVFLERRNRFVGSAEIDGERDIIHVADPGRLTELLYPGNRILLRKAPEGSPRKTRWSLMAAMGQEDWVLLNTFLHREVAQGILTDPCISPFGRLRQWKAEASPQGFRSRFDFLLHPEGSGPVWLEVKGCTLRDGQRALFPDAPTTRGTRHLRELTQLSEEGCICAVMFLVFPAGVRCFAPNRDTDPDFHAAFLEAVGAGVGIYPLALRFNGSVVMYRGSIPVCGMA
jgi:sugar fermentation stimulation protein A